MSSIPQNLSDEKALIDCVQRFFLNTMSANFLPDVMGWRKKVFLRCPCFITNSATFLLEEVCTCSNGLALSRKSFPRTRSTVSLILQKQTGSVLLLFLLLIS